MKAIVGVMLCVALMGCASLADPAVLADMSAVAVVSVVSNAEIEWYGERSNPGLLGNIANLASNQGQKTDAATSAVLSRADTLIDQAEVALLAALQGGARALDKETVLDSAAYRGAKEAESKGLAVLKATGYRFVSVKDAELAKGLASQAGADGVLHASFQFSKLMKRGVERNGVMGAQVMLSVNVLDASGKLVFSKSYTRIGAPDVAVALGVYDPQALRGAFEAAVADVCGDLAEDMGP